MRHYTYSCVAIKGSTPICRYKMIVNHVFLLLAQSFTDKMFHRTMQRFNISHAMYYNQVGIVRNDRHVALILKLCKIHCSKVKHRFICQLINDHSHIQNNCIHLQLKAADSLESIAIDLDLTKHTATDYISFTCKHILTLLKQWYFRFKLPPHLIAYFHRLKKNESTYLCHYFTGKIFCYVNSFK